MIRLKFISDGTVVGTKVVNADTGEQVGGVHNIEINVSANKLFTEAKITIYNIELQIEEAFVNHKVMVMK